MAIRRTPKAPKAEAPKKPKTGQVACVTCGAPHDPGSPGSYVMPSLLDPTLYACGRGCYMKWAEALKHRRVEDEAAASTVTAEEGQAGLFDAPL